MAWCASYVNVSLAARMQLGFELLGCHGNVTKNALYLNTDQMMGIWQKRALLYRKSFLDIQDPSAYPLYSNKTIIKLNPHFMQCMIMKWCCTMLIISKYKFYRNLQYRAAQTIFECSCLAVCWLKNNSSGTSWQTSCIQTW